MRAAITKAELVRWILTLERGAAKRIPGLIMELAFAGKIYPKLERKLNLRDPEFGWFYVCVDRSTDVRHWFRIHTETPCLSGTDKILRDALSAQGHLFFAITVAAIAREEETGKPEMKLTVGQWTTEHAQFSERSPFARAYTDDIAKNINNTFKWKFDRPAVLQDGYRGWFMGCSEETLTRLFVTRCLMNFGLSNPVDVDAIAVNAEGVLVFVEFKRKNPAARRWSCNADKTFSARDNVRHAFAIDEMIAPLSRNVKVGNQVFSQECGRRNILLSETQCYGLDLSHYRTLRLCAYNGMKYCYFIWDWTGEREKDTDSLLDLTKVLDHDLRPKGSPSLKAMELGPEHVTGITRTLGEDSGSYTDGVRIQVTFDV